MQEEFVSDGQNRGLKNITCISGFACNCLYNLEHIASFNLSWG